MTYANNQTPSYCLITAEICYYLPDHPTLLQSYIWQEYDLLPNFPVLKRFLEFWDKNLDGKMHSVTVSSTEIRLSNSLRYIGEPPLLH